MNKVFFLSLLLMFQISSAQTLVCQAVQDNLKISVTESNGEVSLIRLVSDEGENTDFMVTEVRKESGLFVSMIDMLNAKGLELNVQNDKGQIAGTLLDIGAPGTQSKTYEVVCQPE